MKVNTHLEVHPIEGGTDEPRQVYNNNGGVHLEEDHPSLRGAPSVERTPGQGVYRSEGSAH